MTAEEKMLLIAKLEGESKTISLNFGMLVSTVGQDLERSGTTTQDLKLFLLSSSMKSVAGVIGSSETITEAMTKLSSGNYWTFINYELFERMTTALCKSGEIFTLLHSYITAFKVYCKRRLFEVPAIVFENATPNSDSLLRFYVKIDKNFSVSVNDIKNIQYEISKVLDVYPLYLIDVNEGCVELTFGCLKSTEEEVFPEEKHEELQRNLTQLRVIKCLRCGKYKLKMTSETVTSEVKELELGKILTLVTEC